MSILDYAVMVLMLAVVLFVGWLSGRKSGDSDEFLMADRSLNKFQVGLSMAATDFGGSGLVAAIGYCYVVGMGGIWWNLAAAPAFLLVGLFLARKLNKLDGATVPDYLGKRYCPSVKYIASVMHICTNVAFLSTQFTISAVMLHAITGLNANVTLVISVVLVIFLTSGGLRAVVNTDDILFIIIVLSVILAVPFTLRAGGGLTALMSGMPDGFMSVGSIGVWTPISWIIMCILSYSTNQSYIQRMVSAKNEGTAQFASLFTAGFYLVISVVLGLIGVAASVLLPGIEDTNSVFPELLVHYFPQGLAGLCVAGVFAATISTGTSILHATVILFVNDLWKPAVRNTKKADNEVLFSKVFLLIIAVFSTVISLFFHNIIDVIYTAGLFYGIAVFAPLIMGINSKIATAKGALASVIGSVAVSLVWELAVTKNVAALSGIPSNLVGLGVSFLLIFTVSALDKKRRKL